MIVSGHYERTSENRVREKAQPVQRRLWRFMAKKIKVTSQQEEMGERAGLESTPNRPLLDQSDAAVKELIRSAMKHGHVTDDQINALLSSEEVKSEQIEDILAKFSEMGVNVVETKETGPDAKAATCEEPEEEAEGHNELVEVQQRSVSAKLEVRARDCQESCV
jgi:RNA polymerase primary sigma factor